MFFLSAAKDVRPAGIRILEHIPKPVRHSRRFCRLTTSKSLVASPPIPDSKTLQGPKSTIWYEYLLSKKGPSHPTATSAGIIDPFQILEDQTMLTDVFPNTASERVYRYSPLPTRARSPSTLCSQSLTDHFVSQNAPRSFTVSVWTPRSAHARRLPVRVTSRVRMPRTCAA